MTIPKKSIIRGRNFLLPKIKKGVDLHNLMITNQNNMTVEMQYEGFQIAKEGKMNPPTTDEIKAVVNKILVYKGQGLTTQDLENLIMSLARGEGDVEDVSFEGWKSEDFEKLYELLNQQDVDTQRKETASETIEVSAKQITVEELHEFLERNSVTRRYNKLPSVPECEHLVGKQILMVDDSQALITSYLPRLYVATNGMADAILYRNEMVEELAKKIIDRKPDIVLMDFNLASDVNGATVTKELRRNGYAGIIVGFSSERGGEVKKMFKLSGAEGSVYKDQININNAINNIDQVVGEVEAKNA